VAEFEVNVSLDIDEMEAKISDWSANVRKHNRLGALDAAEFIKEIVQEKLSMFPHAPGTPTEAPPITGPVGFISGRLHDSIEVRDMPIGGYAKVGTSNVYARIQELGGFAGRDHTTYLPPRPYFRTSIEEDEVGRIFYWHWKEAMEEAMHEAGGLAAVQQRLNFTHGSVTNLDAILSQIYTFD
jgi:phage gpG-like protein